MRKSFSTGRDEGVLQEARSSLEAEGHSVHACGFDVTDHSAVASAIDEIEADIGPIDILFNNAGMQFRTPLEDFPAETWKQIVSANLDSVFNVGQAVARHMIKRGHGKIINTCSVMSELGRYSIAPYTATKGAVKMLTKGMAIDWARHGITVNGIGPGYFITVLNKALLENKEFDAWLRARTPMGRWGNLEELVGAGDFLVFRCVQLCHRTDHLCGWGDYLIGVSGFLRTRMRVRPECEPGNEPADCHRPQGRCRAGFHHDGHLYQSRLCPRSSR